MDKVKELQNSYKTISWFYVYLLSLSVIINSSAAYIYYNNQDNEQYKLSLSISSLTTLFTVIVIIVNNTMKGSIKSISDETNDEFELMNESISSNSDEEVDSIDADDADDADEENDSQDEEVDKSNDSVIIESDKSNEETEDKESEDKDNIKILGIGCDFIPYNSEDETLFAIDYNKSENNDSMSVINDIKYILQFIKTAFDENRDLFYKSSDLNNKLIVYRKNIIFCIDSLFKNLETHRIFNDAIKDEVNNFNNIIKLVYE